MRLPHMRSRLLLNALATLGVLAETAGQRNLRYRAPANANDKLDTMINIAFVLGIVFVIIGVLIGILVVNGLLTPFKNGVNGIGLNLSKPGWGSTSADSLASAFGTVVPILGIVAIFVLVLAVVIVAFNYYEQHHA